MSAALGLLLIAQLNSFEFNDIPGPQDAGDSFEVTIEAKDPNGQPYPYTGVALLSTSRDGVYRYAFPTVVSFSQGTWQGNVLVTLAESLRLKCDVGGKTGLSNEFAVEPGFPDRLFIMLPGEEHVPGTEQGRSLLPPNDQTAGRQFQFDVFLTDAWHNVVAGNDSVFFGSTDTFAVLPGGSELTDGRGTFPATPRAAGRKRLVTWPSPASPVKPDTSSFYNVNPGSFDRLLLLLPGEQTLPGDNRTSTLSPGKTGTPSPLYVLDSFNIRILGCDDCWNRVRGDSDELYLESRFRFGSSPVAAILDDSAFFRVVFREAGDNQYLWVRDRANARQPYQAWLDIRQRAGSLMIIAPDTIRSGETAYIHVTVLDPNQDSVPLDTCWFSVRTGHGQFLDWEGRLVDAIALETNSRGTATARFLCINAWSAEQDTIVISSGRGNLRVEATIGIYVDMGDSIIRDGKLTAFPNPFGFNRDKVEIDYWLPGSMETQLLVADPFGNIVWQQTYAGDRPGGRFGFNRIYWDGRNQAGRRVANGVYYVRVFGTYSIVTPFDPDPIRIGVLW